jgi:hypothetical protein
MSNIAHMIYAKTSKRCTRMQVFAYLCAHVRIYMYMCLCVCNVYACNSFYCADFARFLCYAYSVRVAVRYITCIHVQNAVVRTCMHSTPYVYMYRTYIPTKHFSICIQVVHSGCAFRLYIQVVHSGCAFRLCIQVVHSSCAAVASKNRACIHTGILCTYADWVFVS